MAYSGLPRGTIAFLAGLQAQNSRDWFAAHQDDYARDWLQAGLDLVAALSGPCAEVGLMAVPRLNASLRRIHRDVRFARDKRPFDPRLHVILSKGPVFNKGSDFNMGSVFNKGSVFNRGPGVHLLIAPTGIGFGAGVYGLSSGGLQGFRRQMCQDDMRAGFEAVLAGAATVGAVLDPPELVRVPAGFAAAPWDGLIRRKSVIVRSPHDRPHPGWLFGSQAVEGWMEIVRALAPLCHWVAPFAGVVTAA